MATAAAAAAGRGFPRSGSGVLKTVRASVKARTVTDDSLETPSLGFGDYYDDDEYELDQAPERNDSYKFFQDMKGSASVDRFTSSRSIAKSKKGCMSNLVIDPDQTPLLLKWDLLMVVALGFVATVTPVEVSMLEVRIDAIFVVNRMVDLVFLIDMLLQFFLKYPVKTRYCTYMENRHSYIVRNYLSTWFLLDFACTVPYDLISLTSNDSALSNLKVVRALRLLRLLKLTRTLKGSRMMRRFEMQLSLSYQRVSLLKFFVLLTMVGHWMACAWCATLRLVDASKPRWVDDIDAQEQSKTTDQPWLLYQASLYFALYTMTSMGYGDVHPANVLERAICVLFLLISGVCWAYIIGQVTCIVASMGQMKQQYHNMLDQVNFMMHERGIPPHMKVKLRRFFLSTKNVQRYRQQWELVSEMSSGLQGQVAMMTHAMWLGNIGFLKDFLAGARLDDIIDEAIQNHEVHFSKVPAFVLEISLAMDFRMYASEESFGKAHRLYILSTGLAMRGSAVKRPGAVWGEDFVLSDSTLLAPVSTLSLSYVEVLMLSASDFLHICDRNRRQYPELPRAVRRHVVRLACRRGILAEARRRRALAGLRDGAEGPAPGETPARRRSPRSPRSPRPGQAAPAAPASQLPPASRHELRALQEDIASLKEVQRQNAEMMDFLAKHEAILADKLRARARRGGGAPDLCVSSMSAPSGGVGPDLCGGGAADLCGGDPDLCGGGGAAEFVRGASIF